MSRTRILIVHPDPAALAMLGSMLRSPKFEIIEATSDPAAVRMLEQGAPAGLVLHGVDPDDADALELLSYVRRRHPGTPVVLLFAAPHPGRYSRALHLGAAVLTFPVPASQLRAAVAQALESGGSPRSTEGRDEGAGRSPREAPQAGAVPFDIEAIVRPRPDGTSGDGRCTCTCHTGAVGEARSTEVIVQAGAPLRPLKEALEGPEREIIVGALRSLGGSRQETARALEINRTTLYKKMRKYGLLDEGDR